MIMQNDGVVCVCERHAYMIMHASVCVWMRPKMIMTG